MLIVIFKINLLFLSPSPSDCFQSSDSDRKRKSFTFQSLNSRKRSGWANVKCLAIFDVLPPVVSSFTFIFCFVWKVIPYFPSTVHYLLIVGALIEFNLFDPLCCSVVTFTGCAAIFEALSPTGEIRNSSVWNTELSKIMISYRLKYNRYRYFSSTSISRIPNIKLPPICCSTNFDN